MDCIKDILERGYICEELNAEYVRYGIYSDIFEFIKKDSSIEIPRNAAISTFAENEQWYTLIDYDRSKGEEGYIFCHDNKRLCAYLKYTATSEIFTVEDAYTLSEVRCLGCFSTLYKLSRILAQDSECYRLKITPSKHDLFCCGTDDTIIIEEQQRINVEIANKLGLECDEVYATYRRE